jgi:uncharacterized membrane protein YkvA (DUF1232 family)
MADQLGLFPQGLGRSQLARLTDLSDRAAKMTRAELLQCTQQHLARTRTAFERNRMVNVRLAEAIGQTIEKVTDRWDALPTNARNWFVGAIVYFSSCDDEEPDFDSPIGFEDDAEVLNACLRFAKMDDLCLNVEDYDDA